MCPVCFRCLSITGSLHSGPEDDVVRSVLPQQQQDGLQRIRAHLCRCVSSIQLVLVFRCLLKIVFNVTGEIKGGKVSGFHNWIQFYLLEKRGKMNYYSHSFNGPVSVRGAGLMATCCTLSLIFFLPLSPPLSGQPTPMCWGCSSCGMATTSRWVPPSSAAALSSTLPCTACVTSPAPENSEYTHNSCNALSSPSSL